MLPATGPLHSGRVAKRHHAHSAAQGARPHTIREIYGPACPGRHTFAASALRRRLRTIAGTECHTPGQHAALHRPRLRTERQRQAALERDGHPGPAVGCKPCRGYPDSTRPPRPGRRLRPGGIQGTPGTRNGACRGSEVAPAAVAGRHGCHHSRPVPL